MIVKDLIDKLKELDPNQRVFISLISDFGDTELDILEKIEIFKNHIELQGSTLQESN